MRYRLGSFYKIIQEKEEIVARCVSVASDECLFLKFEPKSTRLIGSYFSHNPNDDIVELKDVPQSWYHADEMYVDYCIIQQKN